MLGFGPPRYSLKLGPRQAAWAVRSRDWRGRPHLWSAVVDLPSVLGEEPTGWVSILDEGFTFMVHQAGRPVFVRTKTQSPQIQDDLVTSLAFYEETHPGTALRRLYVLNEERESDTIMAISKELDLDVVPVGPTLVQRAWRVPLDEATPPGVLPAIAALAPMRKQDLPAVDLSGSHYVYWGRVCAALVLVSLLLVGLIAWNVREARAIRAQAMQVEQALVRVQEQDRQVQLGGQLEGVDLSDPAMGRLAAQVGFANDLIAKRVFSWTRFLSDLEETVPPRVSINSIRIDFKDAIIAIGGSALSLKDLTAFIISVEDLRAFKDATLLQHRVRDNDIVEFSLTVRYQSQAMGS